MNDKIIDMKMLKIISLFSPDKRAALSPDPAKREAVIRKNRNWKAVCMAIAMYNPDFRRRRKDRKDFKVMADDFTAQLRNRAERYEFVFKRRSVVIKCGGEAIGEIDFSLRSDFYLGRYLYCNKPNWGSELKMGFLKWPSYTDWYEYGRTHNYEDEENATWIPCGLLVREDFRGRGLGVALVGAALMRAFVKYGARFAAFGEPEEITNNICTKLGICSLSRRDIIAGNINPALIEKKLSSILEIES